MNHGRRRYAAECMRTNATTAWDYFDACVFVAHRPGPLIDDDFAHFLVDLMVQKQLRSVIVRASEGAPRADHRAQLLRWYREHAVRGAVLTDSVIARGGVTALSWFGVSIRAFEPSQLDAALDYVQIASPRWADARQRMQRIVEWVDRK
jgi:hypothetical protein